MKIISSKTKSKQKSLDTTETKDMKLNHKHAQKCKILKTIPRKQ